MNDDIVVHAVGDVFVDRDEPAEAFSLVDTLLGAADVVFGNCEVPLSVEPATTQDTSFVARASSATGIRAAGFNVMSCANNHVMDAAPDVMLATLDALRSHGIATVGAGGDRVQAHRPAVARTAHETTVAVVAYASYFRVNDAATSPRWEARRTSITHVASAVQAWAGRDEHTRCRGGRRARCRYRGGEGVGRSGARQLPLGRSNAASGAHRS